MHFTHSSGRSQSDKKLINGITKPYLMAQMEPCTYATKQRLSPIWEPETDLLVSVSQMALSVRSERTGCDPKSFPVLYFKVFEIVDLYPLIVLT